MNSFWKFLIVFLAVTGAVTLATSLGDLQLGRENYWDHHGFLFLAWIALFPRLTLLFSSVASGGFLWWLSWFFAPRLLVAFLATLAYWQQNPVLVVIAWVIAWSGETSEKYVVVRRTQGFSGARNLGKKETEKDVIDAEWTEVK